MQLVHSKRKKTAIKLIVAMVKIKILMILISSLLQLANYLFKIGEDYVVVMMIKVVFTKDKRTIGKLR